MIPTDFSDFQSHGLNGLYGLLGADNKSVKVRESPMPEKVRESP